MILAAPVSTMFPTTGIQDRTKSWKDATFHNLTGDDALSGYRSEDVVLKNKSRKQWISLVKD